MSEERPVKLRFFDKETADKCVGLAYKLGLDPKLIESEGVWQFSTDSVKSTQRRDFISKWANISMERITE